MSVVVNSRRAVAAGGGRTGGVYVSVPDDARGGALNRNRSPTAFVSATSRGLGVKVGVTTDSAADTNGSADDDDERSRA